MVTEFEKYYTQTTTLINQLGSTEASSFRYTKNSKGQHIFHSTETKDIGEIKDLYDKAITMLAHTSGLISPYTDFKCKWIGLNNFFSNSSIYSGFSFEELRR